MTTTGGGYVHLVGLSAGGVNTYIQNQNLHVVSGYVGWRVYTDNGYLLLYNAVPNRQSSHNDYRLSIPSQLV